MECPTVRIKPSSPEQGEYIVINEADFDPTKHTLYEADVPAETVVPAKRAYNRKQG